MAGLIIILIVSWLLLWLVEKKSILALGLTPRKSRLFDLLFGFVAAISCYCFYIFLVSRISGIEWYRNTTFSANNFFGSSWWVLRSVLFEELVFRGALLLIAIRLIGLKYACILSAVAFGIYHWFSYGLIGNYKLMVLVFISTGIWGFMFAMAFAKTKSLYLPLGLHFGHNLVSIVLFSQGPLGKQILFTQDSIQLNGITSLLVYIYSVLALPLVAWRYLKNRTIKSIFLKPS